MTAHQGALPRYPAWQEDTSKHNAAARTAAASTIRVMVFTLNRGQELRPSPSRSDPKIATDRLQRAAAPFVTAAAARGRSRQISARGLVSVDQAGRRREWCRRSATIGR